MLNFYSPGEAARRIRPAAIAVLLTTLFAPALAEAQPISRVNADRMSCDAVQDVIWRRGAVIVRSRSRHAPVTLSERYVSNRGYCFPTQIILRRKVSTRDTDFCPVNLCTENDRHRKSRR